ncbi:hypothetical protein L5515_011873 [Caenorhabditis briggsae]|uniref:Glycine N-acyltransferase-like protein n=1 Tax=Caenorhabditis briggsae TaxID=6238 RepID=A0AAE9EW21_CAEBR|nr:hypothetical protein L5515_011873 [Caenorhabditis briggsae]
MFCKLSSEKLNDFIPFFESKPKFALFANAAKFELEKRLPNHPCDFYYQESNDAKYFYVFRHDRIPDSCRPILMIGSDKTVNQNDVIYGLEQIKAMEPDLGNIELLVAPSELSIAARKFFLDNSNCSEDYNVACNHFYLPEYVYPGIQKKVDEITLPESYSIGSTRVSDTEIVFSTWKFSTPDGILQIKEIIECLPTACILHKDKAVAFEMVGLHGQLNHQFTFPEYRNRGFGTMIENTIVSKCFKEGIQVLKAVEHSNTVVLEKSLNHKLWKVVKEDDGEIIVFNYTQYR